jgi:hypothetical protein
MRIFKVTFLTFILSFLIGCNNSKFSKQEIELKAEKITQILNENNIEIFRGWQSEFRGKGEIWTKYKNNRTSFRAYYFKDEDSTSFMVFARDLKSSEYPCLIEIDTSKYQSNFWFTKSNNGKIKIHAIKNDGTKTIIGENYSEENIFGKENPFSILDNLSNLKNELGVSSIYHNENIGEFIQFYITHEDVLTYIPDELNLNPMYKDVWLENFEKGKMIKKNWNLRHLENPKQGG